MIQTNISMVLLLHLELNLVRGIFFHPLFDHSEPLINLITCYYRDLSALASATERRSRLDARPLKPKSKDHGNVSRAAMHLSNPRNCERAGD